MAATGADDPLLLPRRPSGSGCRVEEDGWRWDLAAAEAKRLVRLAGPLVASCVLQAAINIVSLMFVGHLGKLPLAGAALATSIANVTGFSLLSGMANALGTLCGQAFGAQQPHLLGVYKQRGMVVLGLASLPIALVWACSGELLVLMGQDARIAAEASVYARWLIPSLAAYVPLQCHVQFLQAQGMVLPVTASAGATAICHAAVCWTMVHGGMGSSGAALSIAVSYALNLAILATYVRTSSACRDTWNGFSMEGFKELRRFAGLAVPSAMMVCLEWWSFETLVLLSGLLPNPQLETSVLSVCLNTAELLFAIPMALGIAISTRVSNQLGAGRPHGAKLAMRVVMLMALAEGFFIALTMTLLLGNVWGYMYSSEQVVVSYIAKMMPVLAISFIIDGLHNSLSGVLTGCGLQKIGAAVNLGAFYLAGIPVSVLLAFVFRLNGMGLWFGIVCGSIMKLVLLGFVSCFIDWDTEAVKANGRVFSSSLPIA